MRYFSTRDARQEWPVTLDAALSAGLAADGETSIDRVYHLDRGYANIDRKLAELGALIKRI